eukprot:2152472-Amphidinium_carterae.1
MTPASQVSTAKMESRIQLLGCWYTPSKAALSQCHTWQDPRRPGPLPNVWDTAGTRLRNP